MLREALFLPFPFSSPPTGPSDVPANPLMPKEKWSEEEGVHLGPPLPRASWTSGQKENKFQNALLRLFQT